MRRKDQENELIDPFEVSVKNPLYNDYRKTLTREIETSAEDYKEFQCYLLKRYFKEQRFISLFRFILGLVAFSLTIITFDNIKNLQSSGILLTFLLLVTGVYMLEGIGLLIGYTKMIKKHRQYTWEEKTVTSVRMNKYYRKNYPTKKYQEE